MRLRLQPDKKRTDAGAFLEIESRSGVLFQRRACRRIAVRLGDGTQVGEFYLETGFVPYLLCRLVVYLDIGCP